MAGAAKPRIKPLPKTGDSTAYWVTVGGHGERVVISGCACAASGKTPLQLLKEEIDWRMARWAMPMVSRLTAPSH